MPKTPMKRTSASCQARSPPWPKPSRSLNNFNTETKNTSMPVKIPLMKMRMDTMPTSPIKMKSNMKPKAIVMIPVMNMNMFPQLKLVKIPLMIHLMILMTPMTPHPILMMMNPPMILMILPILMMMKMTNPLKTMKNFSLKCTPTLRVPSSNTQNSRR